MKLPLNSHLAILEDAPVQAEPAEVQAELAPLSDGKADV
jgi:hypothetical protein